MGNFVETIKFSKEFILHPVSVSSIIPSSKNLSSAIMSMSNLENTETIFEFGCGTGSVTREIVKNLNKNAKLFSFDINPAFIKVIKRKYPQAKAINDSVENVTKYMDEYSVDSVDRIISSLPWAAFDDDLQEKLLDITYDVLRLNGEFVTYAYLHTKFMPSHKRFVKMLRKKFKTTIFSSVVWLNVPPAFIIKCRKD